VHLERCRRPEPDHHEPGRSADDDAPETVRKAERPTDDDVADSTADHARTDLDEHGAHERPEQARERHPGRTAALAEEVRCESGPDERADRESEERDQLSKKPALVADESGQRDPDEDERVDPAQLEITPMGLPCSATEGRLSVAPVGAYRDARAAPAASFLRFSRAFFLRWRSFLQRLIGLEPLPTAAQSTRACGRLSAVALSAEAGLLTKVNPPAYRKVGGGTTHRPPVKQTWYVERGASYGPHGTFARNAARVPKDATSASSRILLISGTILCLDWQRDSPGPGESSASINKR
jgi:hypothetical protein